MGYTWSYNSHGTRMVNCLGTWNQEMVGTIDQSYGVFSCDRNVDNRNADVLLDHCLAYVMLDQRCEGFHPDGEGTEGAGIFGLGMNGVRLQRCISAINPVHEKPIRTIQLGQDRDKTKDCRADELTAIGPGRNFIAPCWHGSGVTQRPQTINELIQTWRASPMLRRIRMFAGEDVMARLAAVKAQLEVSQSNE